MALHLSSADIAALEHANTVLLSPFGYDDGAAWQRASALAVESCIGGDASSFALPIGTQPMIAARPDVERALTAISPPPAWIFNGLTSRRRALGLEVTDWDELFDASVVRQTPFYNEVVRPQRLMAPLVMLTETGQGPLPAALSVYFTNERSAQPHANRRKELLRVLFPAFCAGVRTFLAMHQNWAALAALAEDAATGVMTLDETRQVWSENVFLQRLLRSEPERDRVRAEVKRTMHRVLSVAALRRPPSGVRRATSEFRTAATRYRVVATLLRQPNSQNSSRVVALVDRVEEKPIGASEMAARFSLTKREVETALLIRDGLSSRQIAVSLGTSVNTARRHTESILLKLDVHNRTAIAAKLSGV